MTLLKLIHLNSGYNAVMTERARALFLRKPKEIVDNPEGVEKESDIVRRALKYINGGSVLDAGAGMGRNSIFLARNGFRVKALDVRERGLQILEENAKESGWMTRLRIRARIGSVTDGIRGMYRLVVASKMLYFLDRADALKFIQDMKAHTKPGGLNVIETATKDGDVFRGSYPRAGTFYPDKDEVRQLYADWKILEYDEIPMEYRVGPERINHPKNVTAILIAQKP